MVYGMHVTTIRLLMYNITTVVHVSDVQRIGKYYKYNNVIIWSNLLGVIILYIYNNIIIILLFKLFIYLAVCSCNGILSTSLSVISL